MKKYGLGSCNIYSNIYSAKYGFNTFHSLIKDIYSKCILRLRNTATIHLIPINLMTRDIPRRKIHWFNIEYSFPVRYLPYLDSFQVPNIIGIKIPNYSIYYANMKTRLYSIDVITIIVA